MIPEEADTEALADIIRRAFVPDATSEELQQVYSDYEDWWKGYARCKYRECYRKAQARKREAAAVASDIVNVANATTENGCQEEN